jgi:hypothetical protein
MKNSFTRRLAAICLLAASIMIPASTSFGDDVTPAGSGSKSVLFSMSLLNSGAFNGGLGFKYFVMDPLALRGSLQFGVAGHTTPGTGGAPDQTTSASQFGVSVGGEYHFMKSRVSPYGGLDVAFNTTSTDTKNGADIAPFTEVKNVASGVFINGVGYQGGFSFRIGLIGGVEVFVLKEFSIGAECNVGYSMISLYDQVGTNPNTNPTTSVTTKEGTDWTFGINTVGSLILAFYF